MVGPGLETLLQAAYGTAKRVRSETGIVRGPASMASAAVRVARDLHGELDNRTALVVGIGEMGDLMLRQLRAAGLVRVLLAGQSRHVEAAARRMAASRSEERRGGKECVSTCRSRWSPSHSKTKTYKSYE